MCLKMFISPGILRYFEYRINSYLHGIWNVGSMAWWRRYDLCSSKYTQHQVRCYCHLCKERKIESNMSAGYFTYIIYHRGNQTNSNNVMRQSNYPAPISRASSGTILSFSEAKTYDYSSFKPFCPVSFTFLGLILDKIWTTNIHQFFKTHDT